MRLLALALPIALSLPCRAAAVPWHFEAGPREGTFVAATLGPEALITTDGVEAGAGVPAVRFVGTSGKGLLVGEGALCGSTSDLRGSDPGAHRRRVAHHASVRMPDAWPGIDIVHHVAAGHLEHDFRLDAGADPAVIRIRLDGARAVSLQADGSLLADGAAGSLRLRRPIAYQEIGGRRASVECAYRIDGREVTFALGERDEALPLVIDPVLAWSTFVGGTLSSSVTDFAVKDDGSIVALVSSTRTMDATPGAWREAHDGTTLAAIAADGSGLLWATYVPASYVLALRPDGAVVVAGSGYDDTHPVVGGSGPGLGGDVWLGIISSDGTALLASTYLSTDDNDLLAGVTLAQDGDVLVACAVDYPVSYTGDTIVRRLSSDLSVTRWSRVLSGSSEDSASAIASHPPTDDVIVAGVTRSADFPMVNAWMPLFPSTDACPVPRSAWVARLSGTTGATTWSTYLGGECVDEAYAVIADAAGDVIVAGTARSTDFPVLAPAQASLAGREDWFVARFDAGGQLVTSTYLGTPDRDGAGSLALDEGGRVLACGTGMEFPATAAWGLDPVPPPPEYTDFQASVARFDVGGGLSFSTGISGTVVRNTGHEYGSSCHCVAAAGTDILIAGTTDLIDFPTTAGAWHEEYTGTGTSITGPNAGFLSKFGQVVSHLVEVSGGSGAPVIVTRGRPSGLILGWDDTSGGEPGSRFGLYQGSIASLRTTARWDHRPATPCSWAESPATLDMPPGDAYFLVTRFKEPGESSYGRDSFGRERPPSRIPCR
jgi:hypothetical protein